MLLIVQCYGTVKLQKLHRTSIGRERKVEWAKTARNKVHTIFGEHFHPNDKDRISSFDNSFKKIEEKLDELDEKVKDLYCPKG